MEAIADERDIRNENNMHKLTAPCSLPRIRSAVFNGERVSGLSNTPSQWSAACEKIRFLLYSMLRNASVSRALCAKNPGKSGSECRAFGFELNRCVRWRRDYVFEMQNESVGRMLTSLDQGSMCRLLSHDSDQAF